MRAYSHPSNRGQCPFYMDPNDILTAETSIGHCVACATRGDACLQTRQDDFRQLAYLTILEETPKYAPAHPSQASFITFIKARVCTKLWAQRRPELQYLTFPLVDVLMSDTDTDPPPGFNSLTAALYNAACESESLEDSVIDEIHIQQFQQRFPRMLKRLTGKERKAVRLKYFQDYKGQAIAEAIGVSKGRVSQILKSALSKLKTAYERPHADASL
ncbi:sigma-70 family RNA polymerase sigma factor [Candidatus Poribacteria bacterium]|nr:sigma-70 family RNA polymerase sigma factor [Candidatus Poribacteria bacterium]MYK18170.1 sigma-70 family RNA polymerase sigma factor [Candidatus Poribacteria bacterium]